MSFLHRQPEMIDMKKIGGTYHGSGSNLATATAVVAAVSADNNKSLTPDEIESVPDSWVEYTPSRASLCSSIEAINIESTNGGDTSVTNKDDSRLSPISLQSPHVEFESSLEQVKYRLVKDIIVPSGEHPNKSTEWLWDWSARSAGTLNQKVLRHRNGGQIGSTLTTPPNSPEPESSKFEFRSIKSREKSTRKKTYKFFNWSVICRFDVLIALFFTNLMTGAVVYYYLSRMTKCEDTIEQSITKYYW